MLKQYPSLGCCGLDCGMCPAYYTDGPSRCPGCGGEDFFEKHPSCSFITCCVKKRGLEVCAKCEEYPCAKIEGASDGPDVKTTTEKVLQNQQFIHEFGIAKFLEQQSLRIRMLRDMLKHYNDGRSKTFYCLATNLLSGDGLSKALTEAEQTIKAKDVGENDLKGRAKILKGILTRQADQEGEVLKMRKGKNPKK